MDALIHLHLRGSSLIEALVASVLFLIVFTLSLETLSRLTHRQSGGEIQIAMDHTMQACEREYIHAWCQPLAVVKTYPWGTIDITLTPYGSSSELLELTLSAVSTQTRQRIQRRHIIYNPQNRPDNEAR